ncbi:hypothetical protein [Nonomuraea sp. NPDC049141]|uniref:hypothetical protein n=1 Tax=Nonomuraea sp. NPDC049141 TaxID=3155500 RepID=UPI0033D8286F
MTYPPLPVEPTWADLVPGDCIDLVNEFNADMRFTWTISAAVEPITFKPGQVAVPFYSSSDPTRPQTMPEQAERLVTGIGGFKVTVRPSPDRRSA